WSTRASIDWPACAGEWRAARPRRASTARAIAGAPPQASAPGSSTQLSDELFPGSAADGFAARRAVATKAVSEDRGGIRGRVRDDVRPWFRLHQRPVETKSSVLGPPAAALRARPEHGIAIRDSGGQMKPSRQSGVLEEAPFDGSMLMIAEEFSPFCDLQTRCRGLSAQDARNQSTWSEA